jgi:transcriptional regulator of acetoin/glycerol metabolism
MPLELPGDCPAGQPGVVRDRAGRSVRAAALSVDCTPEVQPELNLARAAVPVLERMRDDLHGSPVALVLADQHARVLDVRFADSVIGRAVGGLGVGPGLRLGEDAIGVNAVGTPLETRQSLLVRGAEHVQPEFHPFTCYGYPIIHPVTRRIEGVLDAAIPFGPDDRLLQSLVRHMVQEIQGRLELDATRAQRRLLAAFQSAARRRDRRVIVIGHGLVLATTPALDLLAPADHAALRAWADEATSAVATERLTLVSGQVVRLTREPVDGTGGTLIDIAADKDDHRGRAAPAVQWPVLVTGEPGTGRTTAALDTAGPGATRLEAAEIGRTGEREWATAMGRLLEAEGAAVIVEDIHLLPRPLATLLAKCVRATGRNVVLTATVGADLAGVSALCGERRELMPLRRRRHEIPRLAQQMLADEDPAGRSRLTAESLRVLAAQPWPGNLAELRRVVQSVARLRTAGDITPADLPASHRAAPLPSPFDQAEREVIVAAIAAAGGNKVEAARALGVSRSTLYNRMKALRIY